MMLENMLEQVTRFHAEVTGQPCPKAPVDRLAAERVKYRYDHLFEELEEFDEAARAGDIPKAADALVDLIYVALGGLAEMGFAPRAAFGEVHRANMTKRPGVVAKRGAAHDAVKPADWSPPDFERWMDITVEDVDWLLDQKQMAESYDEPKKKLKDLIADWPAGPKAHEAIPDPYAVLAAPYGGGTKKQTGGKVDYTFVPVEFMDFTSDVFAFGARKYSRHGYKASPPTTTELAAALLRHAFKYLRGQDLDLDPRTGLGDDGSARPNFSGLHHVGHIGCCAAMLAWVIRNRPDRDDRPEKGLTVIWKGE